MAKSNKILTFVSDFKTTSIMVDKIVLNIPHSSTILPVNTWEGDITPHIKKWTDFHTDRLFTPNNTKEVTPVIFPVSRFFCDVERLYDDPLEKDGQGIYYTHFEECKRNEDLKDYAMGLWQSHMNLLSSLITSNDTLLIDCHSFPSDLSGVDICIGYNNDWSKPSDELLNHIKEYFEKAGYSVGINSPYSNSLTPPSTYKYKSFMIEVNKSIYLDKDNRFTSSAYTVSCLLEYLYRNILFVWNC